MSETDKNAAEALINFKPGVISSNTVVKLTTNGTVSRLYLSGNIIAEVRGKTNGKLRITNAGYKTATTNKQLNALPDVQVNIIRGAVYLNGYPWGGQWVNVSDYLPPLPLIIPVENTHIDTDMQAEAVPSTRTRRARPLSWADVQPAEQASSAIRETFAGFMNRHGAIFENQIAENQETIMQQEQVASMLNMELMQSHVDHLVTLHNEMSRHLNIPSAIGNPPVPQPLNRHFYTDDGDLLPF